MKRLSGPQGIIRSEHQSTDNATGKRMGTLGADLRLSGHGRILGQRADQVYRFLRNHAALISIRQARCFR